MIVAAVKRRGVLGINRRNADYTLAWNQRRLYPLVDDKLVTKRLCQEAGIPQVPRLLAVAETHRASCRLLDQLAGVPAFVLKPARGAMGNGILVLDQREGELFRGSRPYSRDGFEYFWCQQCMPLIGSGAVRPVHDQMRENPARPA